MDNQKQVVVIGGGVVGCSVLYHLARRGLKDLLLIERSELTSGSTWHAAGGMHTLNGDPNIAKLQKYTADLYAEIQELSGQDVGLHQTGGVLMAATEGRMDWLRRMADAGSYMDIKLDIISPKEAHDAMPLLDPDRFVGGLRSYSDGHLDPTGVTTAYAKSAKILGAEIRTHCKADSLVQNASGGWEIRVGDEIIYAKHVVNAGGLWAREVGRMVGLELPVLAMEHMYLLTDDMPEVAEANRKTGGEILHAVDFDGELYLRQEGGGMLLGTYEKDSVPWSVETTPWDFGHQLLEPDLDRLAPSLEKAFKHFPAFENAGIKNVINGPFTFAPDGNPLVGPVRGLPNYWVACGVMAGFSQGGGVGLALSNWIVDGDPGMDVFAMDVSRFGPYANARYTLERVKENYSRRFSITYPNQELPAGRGIHTTPIHDILEGLGAQFGASYGLEVPLWYAPEGVTDEFSWQRSTDFKHIDEESNAVRNSVGIADITGFAKYLITGKGAQAWLDRLLACRLPDAGRMTLAPMLKEDGKVIGDFTVAKFAETAFGIFGSGIAEGYHMRWFEQQLPDDGSVKIEALGSTIFGIGIAGPHSRDLLEKLVKESTAQMKFMDLRPDHIGVAPVKIGRISYTGDLGYEIWGPIAHQRYVFNRLMEAGKEFGIRPFGSRAMNSLRLEKNFGSWAHEFRPSYNAVETGLVRFASPNKEADFIGKQALQRDIADGGKLRLVTLQVDAHDADPIKDEPIYFDGKVVGWVTSGGYAHSTATSVAMGYIPKELIENTKGFEVDILGRRCSAKLLHRPLFDPDGSRMRS